MKLLNISYVDTNWELQNVHFDRVNLIIGKNSTGKSKTLGTIDLLYKMLTQKRDLNWGAKWDISFLNNKEDIVNYKFSCSSIDNKGVGFETISINGFDVLRRTNPNSATLNNSITKQIDRVYPPKEKFVIHTNRDVRKYPYLEEIANWAENSFGFKFGNISPYASFNNQEYDLLTAVEDIPSLFLSLKKDSKDRLLKDFNEIGYDIIDVQAQDKQELIILYVTEKGLNKPLPHYKLSQGMFRAISVLIYLEYLSNRKKPATVIIDDLCEGLDFERATKLGKLIFQKCLDNDIQLIATSNDSFLIDVIDLKYINILKRNGKVVSSINNQNSKDIFKDFAFTGLTNFDFFSSNYIKKKIDEKE